MHILTSQVFFIFIFFLVILNDSADMGEAIWLLENRDVSLTLKSVQWWISMYVRSINATRADK